MAINIGTLLVELGVNMGGFIEGMDKATYKSKQAGKEIGEAFRGIGRDIGGILGQFGEVGTVVGEVLSQTGETISKVASQFGGLGGAAGAAAIGVAAVGAAAVAAAAGMSVLAIQGAEVVHQLELASAKTGISVHDLQTLQAAGSTVGVSLDQMVTGFRKFDQALVGIGARSGAANLVLKQFGIQTRDNKEALYEVADAFAKMEDGPTKAAYAVQLFGRAGLNLIPLLDKGRAGLEEFEAIVDRYGPKIGVEAKEANEAYLVSQTKLSLAWDSMKVAAEESILPTIARIITALADATRATNTWFTDLGRGIQYAGAAGLSFVTGFSTEEILNKANPPSEAAKKKDEESPLLLAALKERVAWIKAGGQAEYTVKATEEEITELMQVGTAAALRQAAALEEQLPKLRVAAELEKQRNEYAANPKPTALGADKEKEFLATVDERLRKQRELASAVNSTSGATLIENATLDAQMAIDKQLLGYQGELVKINSELKRAPSGTQASADLLAKKNQLEDFIRTLTADTPTIISKYQEIAAATQINKANAGLDTAIDKLSQQNNALRELAAAYDQGGEAIRRAQIEQSLSKEREELSKASIAYEALSRKVGEYVASMSPEKTALDEAKKKMKEATEIATENADLKIDLKLRDEVNALNANAKAWEITTAAIHGSNEEKIQAARLAAEAIAAAKPGATPEEITSAGTKAAVAEEDILRNKIAQKIEQFDINGALLEEIDLYNRIIAVTSQESTIHLQAEEARKKAIVASQQQWDQAAIDVGTFRQKAAGFLNELVLDGQNFWANFGKAGMQAVTGIEDELAKMLVTGKGSFKQIEQQFEQSILKNSIQTVVSKAAGGLLSATGLGSLLPGLGGKPDGTKGNPMYVSIVNSALDLGGASANGVGGLGNLVGGALSDQGSSAGGGGVGGFFSGILGKLFGGFLAGGGDVTPGKAYVVGEKHPEFFIPGKSGTVVPTLKTGGGSVNNVSVHFHGVTDADSFKKSQSQIGAQIHRSASLAFQRGS
ncbi:Uncharacterised protein [uncultured archaeon]|nr:Uncharacterised protein [uncultured archaeon]